MGVANNDSMAPQRKGGFFNMGLQEKWVCAPIFRQTNPWLWLYITVYDIIDSNIIPSGWWFQPLWKILVSWEYYSQYMKKTCSKPPTSHYWFYVVYHIFHQILCVVDESSCWKSPQDPAWSPKSRSRSFWTPHCGNKEYVSGEP